MTFLFYTLTARDSCISFLKSLAASKENVTFSMYVVRAVLRFPKIKK
jgi:hypothetical protein